MTAPTHTPSRTLHPARLTGPRQVTYVCSCAGFTITDTGDEVKRQWAKHLRNVGVEG